MKIQVLVTTMHQTDLSLYEKMNLQTDAVIANQADENEFRQDMVKGCCVQMVTTKTRGLSRNRNIALAHADADVVVFADDDMRFVDGYEKKIEEEFLKHREADAIKFFVESGPGSRPVSWKKPCEFKKATRRGISSAGVVALAVKTEVLKKHNLHFHENFGTGTENFSGEDTIFLQEMIRDRIRLFVSPLKISEIQQGKSSWFQGYDERYFETAGLVLRTVYPILSYVIAIRSAARFSQREDCRMNFPEILKAYYKGIRKHC